MIASYELVRHAMTVAAFAALIRQGFTAKQIVASVMVPAIV